MTSKVTALEDRPVMPVHWSTFRLMPFNLFGSNLAMTIQAVQ